MIHFVNDVGEFRAAARTAGHGDLIKLGPGSYGLEPAVPEAASLVSKGSGAGILFQGIRDLEIEGVNRPVIFSTRPGTILEFKDCPGLSVRGLRIEGNGYTLEPLNWYFSGILLTRCPYARVENCQVVDVGDQGIAEQHYDGPSASDHATVRNCYVARCGHLAHPYLPGDGAGIAIGAEHVSYLDNLIEDCFRGIEHENSVLPHSSSHARIEGNTILRSLSQAIGIFVQHGNADLFTDIQIVGNHIEGPGAPVDWPATVARVNGLRVPLQLPPVSVDFSKVVPWGKNGHGIALTGGRRLMVYRNTVKNIFDYVGLEAAVLKSEFTDCTFAFNTFFNCGRGAFWLVPGDKNGYPIPTGGNPYSGRHCVAFNLADACGAGAIDPALIAADSPQLGNRIHAAN